MADLNDDDDQPRSLHLIDHPVVANTDSEEGLSGLQLLASRRKWIISKTIYLVAQPSLDG
jgi:hypothetical protein